MGRVRRVRGRRARLWGWVERVKEKGEKRREVAERMEGRRIIVGVEDGSWKEGARRYLRECGCLIAHKPTKNQVGRYNLSGVAVRNSGG